MGSVLSKEQPRVGGTQEAVATELRKEEAALETAKADLAKAETNADRAREVQGRGAVSDEQIPEYLIRYQVAPTALDSAEETLESQKVSRMRTT